MQTFDFPYLIIIGICGVNLLLLLQKVSDVYKKKINNVDFFATWLPRRKFLRCLNFDRDNCIKKTFCAYNCRFICLSLESYLRLRNLFFFFLFPATIYQGGKIMYLSGKIIFSFYVFLILAGKSRKYFTSRINLEKKYIIASMYF